jgi:peptidoglycan/xylan/chitin deacetylase (PgdA/CDA1 family)
MSMGDHDDGVVNMCFHGIGKAPAGLTPDDERYFIPLDLFLTALDEAMGRRDQVRLSFDDGYASDVEVALPALRERGLTARFFPLAGKIGQPGYVDASGIAVLAAAGMPIGSHGKDHRSWRGMTASERQAELVEARQVIGELAGTPVDTAACPFGAYDRGVLASLRAEGYRLVFTSDRRRTRPGAWLQARYSIRRDDTAATMREDVFRRPPFGRRARSQAVAVAKAWR